MNVFKKEWKKLLKLEKALDEYKSYNIPSKAEYLKVAEAFNNIVDFGTSLPEVAYYDLYRRCGNPRNSVYEERLKMYTYHSDKTKWYLPRLKLTENELKTLCIKYHYLKERVIDCFNEWEGSGV